MAEMCRRDSDTHSLPLQSKTLGVTAVWETTRRRLTDSQIELFSDRGLETVAVKLKS